jgi:hypothetical protein
MPIREKKHEEVQNRMAEIAFDHNDEGFVFDTAAFDLTALSVLDSIYKSLESVDQKTVHVKFMITRQEETELQALGYSTEQIDKLKPQEAADIIESGIRVEPLDEQK